MISQTQYIEHLHKIRQIKHTRATIKSVSRLGNCHKESRKLRKMNYNFNKKRKVLFISNLFMTLLEKSRSITRKNNQLQSNINKIKFNKKVRLIKFISFIIFFIPNIQELTKFF